jgi:hypothetical protein
MEPSVTLTINKNTRKHDVIIIRDRTGDPGIIDTSPLSYHWEMPFKKLGNVLGRPVSTDEGSIFCQVVLSVRTCGLKRRSGATPRSGHLFASIK